jgi:transcriptional regulator with XRE-family HTH domain
LADDLAIMVTLRAGHGRRSRSEIEFGLLSDEVVNRLGAAVAAGRRRRHLTQAELAARLGISPATVSRIETGRGRGAAIATWLALAAELGLTARFELARDWRLDPVDAGHLAVQELLLRLGRSAGYVGTFELSIGRTVPASSIDVFLRSDRRRRLVVAEAWNVIGDIGAGARSFERKLAAARELAVAIGGDAPYSVHGVWVVRATRRNRALVARYPEVFAARFSGSSHGWAEAIARGARPPIESGLVWTDLRATRVFAWRR